MPGIYAPGVDDSKAIGGVTKNGKNALNVNLVGNENYNHTVYEEKLFTIVGAQNDYNVKTQQSMFSTVPTAILVAIYASVACTISFNTTGLSDLNLLAGEERVFEGFPVTNVYVTTSADTIIRLTLMD